MTDTDEKITKLVTLLEQSEDSPQHEGLMFIDDEISTPEEISPPPPDPVVTNVTMPEPDKDERPPSLRGLTFDEILLLEKDGGLDPEAEEWLSYKNIPNPDGSIRMPNLKAIARRSKQPTLKMEEF